MLVGDMHKNTNEIKSVKWGRIRLMNFSSEIVVAIDLSRYKGIELQIGCHREFSEASFGFNLTYKRKRKVDHHGFSLDFNFFPLYLYFNFCDSRHVEDFENQEKVV